MIPDSGLMIGEHGADRIVIHEIRVQSNVG